MIRTKYIALFLLILSISLLVFMACSKKETIIDPPPPTGCSIITPLDYSVIQSGSLVTVEAAVTGMGEQVKVIFSVDSVEMIQLGQSPFTFLWDTDGLDTGFHKLHADAWEGLVILSDVIDIYIIDTIIPPQPPVPVINIIPEAGTTDTIFIFDASLSHDPNDDVGELMFRWDFEGDGEWDTDFSNELVYEHKYSQNGHYYVMLEAMDTDSMSSDTSQSLLVAHSTTPNPCEGVVSIPYGGKVYHTVPLGDQCWLRENMDIGIMIHGGKAQADNQIIEKYCYNNDTANCDQFGGLYTWKEAMKHAPFLGGRGICPVGYHIPTDDEWKEMEGFVDSQYGVGDAEWDLDSWRGYDAGKRSKAMLGWLSGGNGNNLYGFKVLAAGFWETGFSFAMEGEESHMWSSTHDSGLNAIERKLKSDHDEISRAYHWEEAAFSVRCIRD